MNTKYKCYSLQWICWIQSQINNTIETIPQNNMLCSYTHNLLQIHSLYMAHEGQNHVIHLTTLGFHTICCFLCFSQECGKFGLQQKSKHDSLSWNWFSQGHETDVKQSPRFNFGNHPRSKPCHCPLLFHSFLNFFADLKVIQTESFKVSKAWQN